MSIHIDVQALQHGFVTEPQKVQLFSNLNLNLNAGESLSIMGESGAGKSTLLAILAGLLQPDGGKVLYKDAKQNHMPLDKRQVAKKQGFIFQQFHLLPELNAIQNVAFPLMLKGDKHAMDKSQVWLNKVGLKEKASRPVNKLSGGEQQRLAIARAFINEPQLVFADEPSGSLDYKTAENIHDLMFECCSDSGATLIVVTHDSKLAQLCGVQSQLKNGELVLL